MHALVALIALATGPHGTPQTAHVELIEWNHCYTKAGKHKFDQLIFWEWAGSSYRVRAWSLEDKPMRYAGILYDSKGRRIRYQIYKETWTQYDPEMQNRALHPLKNRRALWP